MQAEAGFTSRHNLVQHGPTISVQIGFDPSYQPSGPIPNLGTSPRPALVDTGAVATCIDSSLAADLQLPIIGRKTISGVLGAGSVYVHLAQIYIPDLDFVAYLVKSMVSISLLVDNPMLPYSEEIFLQYFTMTYVGNTGIVTIRSSSARSQ